MLQSNAEKKQKKTDTPEDKITLCISACLLANSSNKINEQNVSFYNANTCVSCDKQFPHTVKIKGIRKRLVLSYS